MKIEKLKIKNYKQFLELELDFYYPKGHKKEGQSLDKICIIGQSGTGKTNLLDIIKKSVIDFSGQTDNSYLPFSKFTGSNNRYIASIFKTKNNTDLSALFTPETSTINFNKKNATSSNEKNYFISSDRKPDKKNNKKRAPLNVILNEKNLASYNITNKKIINLNDRNNLWLKLKENIENHEHKKNIYMKKLFKKIIHNSNYSKEDSINDMKNWENRNENFLEKTAHNINSIINKFNLELKINENTNSYEELTIKDLANNNIIKYDDLSTGTKNLLSTFIPLKSYNPKDSIILIDEPENSFYPDIQRQLTELYMDIGENNQLIMATHSPLIASSFEPWEVVELKFDKNNQVYRELYYEGDNHVDNYTLDPRMLTWTGILTDIFDLKEDSNLIFREKKLMEFAMLKSNIKSISDIKEKEKLFKELQKIGKQLGTYNQ